jgi:hypothetical protein
MTRLFPGAVLAVAMMLVTACRPSSPAADLTVQWQLTPAAPVVGREVAADVTIQLPSGRPVLGARLNLEGHMSHPGMAPVIAPMTHVGEGRYRAVITLTMSGDWAMFVSGELADGQAVRQRVADVVAGAE